MGIRKRGESYEVNVTYKGQRKFGTAPTEAEAKDLYTTYKAELINASKAQAPLQTQPEPTQKFVSWTLKKAIETTFEVQWNGTAGEGFYKSATRMLVKYFGEDKLLSEIDTAAVDAFRDNQIKSGLQTSTINHRLAALSRVFTIAKERKGAQDKPALGLKKVDRGRVRFLSEEEEFAVLGLLKQWGKQEAHDWIVVLIDTGLRPSESKRLLPSWVDFKTGLLHCWESKTKAGVRAIPMTKRVRAVLERRCLADPKKKLFPLTYDVLTNAWEKVRKALNLTTDPDFVVYALRHTFATRLVQRGEQIAIVQKLLGHETPAMTMIYAHFGAEQYVNAIAKLEPREVTL